MTLRNRLLLNLQISLWPVYSWIDCLDFRDTAHRSLGASVVAFQHPVDGIDWILRQSTCLVRRTGRWCRRRRGRRRGRRRRCAVLI